MRKETGNPSITFVSCHTYMHAAEITTTKKTNNHILMKIFHWHHPNEKKKHDNNKIYLPTDDKFWVSLILPTVLPWFCTNCVCCCCCWWGNINCCCCCCVCVTACCCCNCCVFGLGDCWFCILAWKFVHKNIFQFQLLHIQTHTLRIYACILKWLNNTSIIKYTNKNH